MTSVILVASAALILIAAVWFTIRRARERREALIHLLAQQSRALDEVQRFSTALVHEIRGPLAVLRSEIEQSLASGLSPEEIDARAAAQLTEIDRLAAMIGRLLTLARAEAGEIALTQKLVDLSAVGRAVVEALAPVANAKGLELTYLCTRAVHVTGDPGWLKQLLVNLVDNAIKFTPKGGVVVAITCDVDTATLSVRDSGVGIPAEAIGRIFDRFYRAGSSRAEGFGLGLSLVKWIATQHGGSIDVISSVGNGSTFTVRMRRAISPDEQVFIPPSRYLHVRTVQ